jgi:RNA polymerase-binding transcription factor DksA
MPSMTMTRRSTDQSSAVCPHCDSLVRTREMKKTVTVNRTRLRIPNVTVAVCPECGGMISVARHSLAQFREAGVPK